MWLPRQGFHGKNWLHIAYKEFSKKTENKSSRILPRIDIGIILLEVGYHLLYKTAMMQRKLRTSPRLGSPLPTIIRVGNVRLKPKKSFIQIPYSSFIRSSTFKALVKFHAKRSSILRSIFPLSWQHPIFLDSEYFKKQRFCRFQSAQINFCLENIAHIYSEEALKDDTWSQIWLKVLSNSTDISLSVWSSKIAAAKITHLKPSKLTIDARSLRYYFDMMTYLSKLDIPSHHRASSFATTSADTIARVVDMRLLLLWHRKELIISLTHKICIDR